MFFRRKKLGILLVASLISGYCSGQTPIFGNEIPVTITGLTFDAMEPFLSTDGNTLIFNSLNDGLTTSLYYATKVNDSTFTYQGLVPLVNQSTTPRLDAVASGDTAGNFYWVSTRDYPANFDNLQRIVFPSGTGMARVHGNIYVYAPGWIIMDAAISYGGDQLFYCNAYFNNCPSGMPCRSVLGIAQKVNDSTFAKLSNSATLLAAVNDTANYIVYAPQLSKDGLELYFTRAQVSVPQTEICVAVRSNTSLPFGAPVVLITSPGNTPEAPTLSADQSKMYYHRKNGSTYQVFLRYRTGTTGVEESEPASTVTVFPNPATGLLYVKANGPVKAELYNSPGALVLTTNSSVIDLQEFPAGVYTLRLFCGNEVINRKIILVATGR